MTWRIAGTALIRPIVAMSAAAVCPISINPCVNTVDRF
jgi:hypothetical protein